MAAKEKRFNSGEILKKCMEDILGKTSLSLTQDTVVVERDIIEYASRMRIFGMEKFNGACALSCVNFSVSEEALKSGNTIGGLIVFIEEEEIGRTLKSMGYTDFHDDIDEEVFKKMGELCKKISDSFKEAVKAQGYPDFFISAPAGYKNDIPEGILFPYSEYKYHEITFYMWKKKVIVLNVILAA